MNGFVTLLQQGNSWLFAPSAVLLGALHGLEPGHSKTMMAAFIVAIRGTLTQAVLLALAATASHTAIVWAVALGGLYFGRRWNSAATEPYLQVISALLIVVVALWMLRHTWRQRAWLQPQGAARAYDHDRRHGHGEVRRIDTGHGVVRLQTFGRAGRARFRLSAGSGPGWPAEQVRVETERADGRRASFSFRRQLSAPGYEDPHELAHANDIRRRFAAGQVSNAQIVLFGLTGGLLPCPASITVLLLCLQLKRLALGATLVLCFSVGLALTLVASGAVAALGARHAARRFPGFGELARQAPYASGCLILLVGLYLGYRGLQALA